MLKRRDNRCKPDEERPKRNVKGSSKDKDVIMIKKVIGNRDQKEKNDNCIAVSHYLRFENTDNKCSRLSYLIFDFMIFYSL